MPLHSSRTVCLLGITSFHILYQGSLSPRGKLKNVSERQKSQRSWKYYQARGFLLQPRKWMFQRTRLGSYISPQKRNLMCSKLVRRGWGGGHKETNRRLINILCLFTLCEHKNLFLVAPTVFPPGF